MTTPTDEASFEETIKKLGEIVRRLEEGELTLEQSLTAFEQGVTLLRAAQGRLDAAQARVDELLGVDEQGRATTKPMPERDSDPGRR
ncbi:MAG: exodeoxyribonuclease VII small subunit [Deltaproteobacteria bacterium]|nr:exodeoxyribonuclease VII small subunit [Deltaproteobacteria bacterium]